jgi:hypothetical protein
MLKSLLVGFGPELRGWTCRYFSIESTFPTSHSTGEPAATEVKLLDCSGMRPREILDCIADCATFEADVRRFCTNQKKVLLLIKTEGTAKRVQIRT